MTTQEFFDELELRIAKYDLLCHPFYKAWAAGQLSREDLTEYGRQYFKHVEQFPAYLEEFAARVQDGQICRAVMANHAEETGADGSRPHSELWLDFVEGIGGPREVEQESPDETVPQVGRLVNWFHSVAREGAPEEALSAFYAYESQVPRVAAEKARGLREMYGADAKTCSYFTLHTTADVNHSRVWKNQLAKLIEHNPEGTQKALAAGEQAAQMLWHALDAIEAARMERAAAQV